ncbi:MAG: hypothetical protein JWN48_1584 [Myxococcaceae bacterium]|nr:hypothetical protein [Myxococcaceae bacterium]
MQIALVLLALLVAACQKSPEPQPEGSSAQLGALDAGLSVDAGAVSAAAARTADGGPPLSFVGTVRGVVKLATGAKLPLAPFPMQNGVLPVSVAPCPPVDATDQRNTVSLAKQTGGLFPVHVAITGMTGAPKREPVTHEVFIDACRLRPSMIGAMKGDQLKITNRSEAALVPRLPGDSFMRGLMNGESHQGPLKLTRTIVDCSFGSYCGESLVVATSHSLYAVTSTEGFFTIEHVPLHQKLTIHAWNPLFEVSSAPFTLSEREPEQMIELTLTPTAAAAATKLGKPKPPPAPKVIVHRVDGGVVVEGPGPAYE